MMNNAINGAIAEIVSKETKKETKKEKKGFGSIMKRKDSKEKIKRKTNKNSGEIIDRLKEAVESSVIKSRERSDLRRLGVCEKDEIERDLVKLSLRNFKQVAHLEEY